jgi:predicted secreted protein
MTFARRSLLAAAALLIAAPAFAQTKATSLFKIVSVKDEVVIGLSADELAALGGTDAGAVAKALAAKGTLTVWQYAVRKAANGDLEQAPRAKIGLIAHDSLRVEPYPTPLKVIAHE